ncbi:RNA polymerase III subunit I isoform X2 [Rhodnius prolixus]|uniref:DNA-directed RNA polymerase III subunit RPC9 n=1 Tax=Rhodnius prolixus TaxID=13249 RepID=A0A4P6DH40_RHOPR
MEVKQADAGSLCNCEVFCLLNDCKETIVIRSKTGNQFATILYEASQYLQNNLAGQTEQDVKNMMTALLHFPVPLTHDEKLMIVNTLPRTPLELSVIVHNYDERLTGDQVEKLLTTIASNCS